MSSDVGVLELKAVAKLAIELTPDRPKRCWYDFGESNSIKIKPLATLETLRVEP